MAQTTALAAEVRDASGKGAARATRRAGRVPCVIYGNKEDQVMITIDPLDLQRQLRGPGFFSRVFEIEVNGKKHRVLARELQLDPVSDRPIHVDFMRFSASTRLNIDVQVVFQNHEESPGIKRGGVLNIVRHTIEMRCNPDHIPESVIIDLTGLDIGDSVHISAIELPGDVELTIADRDFTIATIAAPTLLVEVEDEEGAEGEGGVKAAEGEAAEGAEGEGKAGDGDSKDSKDSKD
ncbi:MAG: 50S ribosomal protein L25/general stress protein Ctc [Proteobacteria bacterium]|nr:50S ribosomal protein L25/general stress protein Ctc [Pseudomonadota bacterium]MDA1022987.1 50S ribosomal protein L25/general stress protein Ctc [Pseudomonadota bacterium]